eukprot:593507-Rhodomonas_salina.2
MAILLHGTDPSALYQVVILFTIGFVVHGNSCDTSWTYVRLLVQIRTGIAHSAVVQIPTGIAYRAMSSTDMPIQHPYTPS